ncbi:unnamed protein product, partial [Prorocentrum cordatum]
PTRLCTAIRLESPTWARRPCAALQDPHAFEAGRHGEPRGRQSPHRRRAAAKASVGMGGGTRRGARTEAATEPPRGPRAPPRRQARGGRGARARRPRARGGPQAPGAPAARDRGLLAPRRRLQDAEARHGPRAPPRASPGRRRSGPSRGPASRGAPPARSGAGRSRGRERPVERHRVGERHRPQADRPRRPPRDPLPRGREPVGRRACGAHARGTAASAASSSSGGGARPGAPPRRREAAVGEGGQAPAHDRLSLGCSSAEGAASRASLCRPTAGSGVP